MEKAKTDCHDEARAGRCSRGFFESLKIFSALGEESALSDLGVYSAPSSFRIPGTTPKFKIIELLWLSEGDKAV